MGPYEFDSMLYPMYLDAPSGTIGVMEPPPGLVHFNGTIVSYRFFRMGRGKVDELFRLLLLAMLEDLIPCRRRAGRADGCRRWSEA